MFENTYIRETSVGVCVPELRVGALVSSDEFDGTTVIVLTDDDVAGKPDASPDCDVSSVDDVTGKPDPSDVIDDVSMLDFSGVVTYIIVGAESIGVFPLKIKKTLRKNF